MTVVTLPRWQSSRPAVPIHNVAPGVIFRGTLAGVSGVWLRVNIDGAVLLHPFHPVGVQWKTYGCQSTLIDHYTPCPDAEIIVRD